jgi:hypothetical protein
MTTAGWLTVAASSALFGIACGKNIELGRDVPSNALAPDSSVSNGDAQPICTVTRCRGNIYACGDCLDNDGDELVDAADPECLGPCDNTEDSFYSGIPGQNSAPCKLDCTFDLSTGNDGCHWSHKCDPLSLAPDYPPSGESQCAYDPNAAVPETSATCAELGSQQSASCLNVCLPLTPNGCDCFGCCELPASTGRYVWIGSTLNGVGSCDAAHADDSNACRPCTPVMSCFNDCNPCEVCAGRPQPSPRCTPGTDLRCPQGKAPCGLSEESSCIAGDYCVSGCCTPAPG